jgi:hypothetical protein
MTDEIRTSRMLRWDATVFEVRHVASGARRQYVLPNKQLVCMAHPSSIQAHLTRIAEELRAWVRQVYEDRDF